MAKCKCTEWLLYTGMTHQNWVVALWGNVGKSSFKLNRMRSNDIVLFEMPEIADFANFLGHAHNHTHIETDMPHRKNASKPDRPIKTREITQLHRWLICATGSKRLLCNALHKVYMLLQFSFSQTKRQRKSPHKLIRMNNANYDLKLQFGECAQANHLLFNFFGFFCVCCFSAPPHSAYSQIHQHLFYFIFHFLCISSCISFHFLTLFLRVLLRLSTNQVKQTEENVVFNAYLFGGVRVYECTSGFLAIKRYECRLLTIVRI